MQENLCDEGQLPGPELFSLYRTWAEGGAGIILTGNVFIHPAGATEPGGVVLEEGTPLEPFKRWAKAGRSGGGHMWMQINHPGRQMFAALGQDVVSASDVAIDVGKFSGLFARPRALTAQEIEEYVQRWATTARLAQNAGFTGVQIHAAHGYLIGQFLSPLSNRREDQWGGSINNRARFLFDIIRAVRAAVNADFCVSVKLNSADFQKGGFDENDARWVVKNMADMGVDLIELSGGNYESPATLEGAADEATSTGRREAYFVAFARDVAKVSNIPIMVTGGIRRRALAENALAKDLGGFGVSVLGIARAMAFVPDLPNQWQAGTIEEVCVPEVSWRIKEAGALAAMALTSKQLHRIANGKSPSLSIPPLFALIWDQLRNKRLTKRYTKWRRASKT